MTSTPVSLLAALAAFALFINVFAYAVFWLDKRRAVERGWRVPEVNLLALALFGGWIGAKLAQHGLRHKTRKQPFGMLLNAIALLWILGAPALLVLGPRLPALPAAAGGQETASPLPRRFGPDAPHLPGDSQGALPRRFGPEIDEPRPLFGGNDLPRRFGPGA